MKKMFSTVAVATAALVAVTPATAQNFTGVRGEIRAGWDRVSVEDAEIEFKASKSGVTYGAGLGYDFALGAGLIAGAEADFDLSSTRFHVEDEDFAASIRARRDIEISARLGAVVSKNVLLYAKAGYTNARMRAEVVGSEIDEALSGNGDGLRLGAGIEFALGRGAYVKTEYRYSNYEGGVTRNQVITGLGFRF